MPRSIRRVCPWMWQFFCAFSTKVARKSPRLYWHLSSYSLITLDELIISLVIAPPPKPPSISEPRSWTVLREHLIDCHACDWATSFTSHFLLSLSWASFVTWSVEEVRVFVTTKIRCVILMLICFYFMLCWGYEFCEC